jgi:glycolate oxidase FAD binding subunit
VTAVVSESVLTPASEGEAAEMVREAASAGRRLEIAGGGTRRGLGRPVDPGPTLSSSKLSGISFYEPAELVIGAKAGTPLAEVESALSERGQMLAFEPMDHRPLYATTGEPTIGGVAAVNASGPRRIAVGAARDALLGVRFVNGNGEMIKSGGRVMKNVTGLDLVKLLCGSHGTLGILTEVTFKVLPRPQRSATLLLHGLNDRDAIAALIAALGSPFDPNAAAHLPSFAADEGTTAIRVEGFSESVDHRLDALSRLWADRGATSTLDGDASMAFWQGVRDAAPLAEPRDSAVWRLSTAPSAGPAIVAKIAAAVPDARWFYDWGGGLIWLAVPSAGDAGAAIIRQALAGSGHATLVRAPVEIRRRVPVFQPLPSAAMKLTDGIKRSFDPAGVFSPGRMYAGL